MDGSPELIDEVGAVPFLVGIALTSTCFGITGLQFWPTVLLAGLVVPAAVRSCFVRDQRASDPTTVLEPLFLFLSSVGRTALILGWFGFVVLATDAIKQNQEAIVVLPFVLLGLTLWLIYLLIQWQNSPMPPRERLRVRWRIKLRDWLTIRGLLALVALIAALLWPVHLWRMVENRRLAETHEGWVARLYEGESEMMADRAEECRRRARAGADWNASDDVTEGLKLSPYPSENPGRSWLEQIGIWERAAERGRQAAQRHRNRAR